MNPPPEVLAELTALADGTLDPERAAALRRQIAGSPELSKRYERERHAVAALATVRADRAPAGAARADRERATPPVANPRCRAFGPDGARRPWRHSRPPRWRWRCCCRRARPAARR